MHGAFEVCIALRHVTNQIVRTVPCLIWTIVVSYPQANVKAGSDNYLPCAKGVAMARARLRHCWGLTGPSWDIKLPLHAVATVFNSIVLRLQFAVAGSCLQSGAHQQAQSHRGWPFGDAHARCFEAAAEHAHFSNNKARRGWDRMLKRAKYINILIHRAHLCRYEKVGQKSVRFVGVDNDESGKDSSMACMFARWQNALSILGIFRRCLKSISFRKVLACFWLAIACKKSSTRQYLHNNLVQLRNLGRVF